MPHPLALMMLYWAWVADAADAQLSFDEALWCPEPEGYNVVPLARGKPPRT